jgi:hypothetical protein
MKEAVFAAIAVALVVLFFAAYALTAWLGLVRSICLFVALLVMLIVFIDKSPSGAALGFLVLYSSPFLAAVLVAGLGLGFWAHRKKRLEALNNMSAWSRRMLQHSQRQRWW